jgi:ubiquinone biosynthesis protein
MILEHGELHSDPHPGNVLVTEAHEIIFLDFGSVTAIPDDVRRAYLRLVMAFVANDRDTVVDALHTIGFRTKSGKPDTLLVFADALLGSFAKAQGEAVFPTKEELIAEAKNVLVVAENDPVTTLPPEFIMIARVFGSISGLFLMHRPKLDVGEWILPALARAMAK